MEKKIILFGSAEYRAMVDLRIESLLAPIGIPASYINPGNEKEDIFLGVFEQDSIVGCCILTKKTSSEVQLRQMAVKPSMQSRGLGAIVISFAEETAIARGYERIVMNARDPVLGFYKKCGYIIEGEQFMEVGMGHHKMCKTLV